MRFDILVEATLNGVGKGATLKKLADKHGVDIEVLKKQLAVGIKVEIEHTKQKSIAKTIAMDHLFEDPKYYTKLAKVEKK